MESSNLSKSTVDETTMHFLTAPQNEAEQLNEWSGEENKLFENALTEVDDDPNSSPQLFKKMATEVPGESVEEIEKHYEALVEVVEKIEAGKIPLPENNQSKAELVPGNQKMKKKKKGTTSSVGKKRRQTWTEEKHKKFMKGYEKRGRGRWKTISNEYVPRQVARRFFQRLHNHQSSTANNIIKTTAVAAHSSDQYLSQQIPENQPAKSNSYLSTSAQLPPSFNNTNAEGQGQGQGQDEDEEELLDLDKFPSIYD